MRARSLYRAPASFRVAADWVTVERGGDHIPGYLAAPHGCMLFGAVIAASDEVGVGEHLRETAHRLAAEGFVTLAVDLFGRESAESRTAIPRLQAGFDYLANRLDVDAECIGALGYGRGGGAVLAWSRVPNKLACAVVFCAPPEPFAAVASGMPTACPMQLHFWAADATAPFEEAQALKRDLAGDGEGLVEFHAYRGDRRSGLDFMEEVRSPEARTLAFRRMRIFFGRHLGDWSAG